MEVTKIIISECCTNWHDLAEAKEMIRVSKECGASAAKFQLFDAEEDKGKPWYEWVKAHELTFDQAKELFYFGQVINQEVFFSVFAPKFVDWCQRIGVKRYKVAACDWPNKKETCRAIKDTAKPVICSGGGFWCHDIEYLYCPPGYPQEKADVRVALFENDMGLRDWDGFSDHSIGTTFAKIALARGASIIEKHFCLQHDSKFPDDKWSMTPEDLKELVMWEQMCLL